METATEKELEKETERRSWRSLTFGAGVSSSWVLVLSSSCLASSSSPLLSSFFVAPSLLSSFVSFLPSPLFWFPLASVSWTSSSLLLHSSFYFQRVRRRRGPFL